MSAVSTSTATPEVLQVLVVDDNASLLRFLVSAFSANGCAVKQAASAEQALTLIGQHAFDLVVSDITMPGLSGLDLLRAIKSDHPTTPVVLITGNPSVKTAVFGLRHGAYDYLPKPFSIREIQQLLARVRADRQSWNGQLALPAGVGEELSRRQSGVETMLQIGDIAQQARETSAVMDEVLRLIALNIKNDCALVLIRDDQGSSTCSQQGAGELLTRVRTSLEQAFADIVLEAARGPVSVGASGEPMEAIAALIPGTGQRTGLVCLARRAASGGFLSDERAMIAGHAQTAGVALRRPVPREDVERSLVATICTLVGAIEARDRYLKGHSARVALYAAETARLLNVTTDVVDVVWRSAMLHDLGNLSTMDAILRNPTRLTAEEFAIIKSHPLVGVKMLEPLRFLAREARAVRHHHERFDGSGYPDGLQAEEIPLAARVVAVADAFDAITRHRPHRTALAPAEAGEKIAAGRGSHFDPVVVDAFLRIPLERLDEIQQHYETLSSGSVTHAAALAAAK